MSNDDELSLYPENGKRHLEMDAKFCARMRAAIARGLESAAIGIVTTPGTKNPKCFANQNARHHPSRNER